MESNAKKPKLPPPPRKANSGASTVGSSTQTPRELPPPPLKPLAEAPNPSEESPNEHTSSTFSGTLGSEKTAIANMQEHTITRIPGRIVPILQVSAGAEQGRLISLAQYKHITVGRSKKCELVVFDPSCSREHSEIFLNPDGRVTLRDLGSTNGTKVNGKRIKGEEILLGDGDRLQLGEGTVLRFTLMPEDDAQMQMEVYYRATRDSLTNAFNRHQFDEALDREVSYQKRAGHGLGVILFDVDHFKKINDSFGHPFGDEVLREIGHRVPTCVRIEDIFARLGGEEFGVLARSESIDGVHILAERIRIAMERKSVDHEGKHVVFTVSVGYTFVKGGTITSAAAIMQTADDALYEAKNAGRNRTVMKETALKV